MNHTVLLGMESTKAAKQKQYRIDNKDAIKAKQKQYNIDNKPAIQVQKEQYNIDNKTAIQVQRKQYQIDNKDDIAEYKREWNINNKEKEAAHDSQKIYCDACECYYRRGSMCSHMRTKTHLANTSQIQN